MALFLGLAVTAGVLALIGLYGVVAQIVGRRRREFGIRVALGADGGSIVRMILTQAVKPIIGGVLLGAVFAHLGREVLESQLFGIEAGDPVTLLGAAAVLVAAAMLATYSPARSASRIDPMKVITEE